MKDKKFMGEFVEFMKQAAIAYWVKLNALTDQRGERHLIVTPAAFLQQMAQAIQCLILGNEPFFQPITDGSSGHRKTTY